MGEEDAVDLIESAWLVMDIDGVQRPAAQVRLGRLRSGRWQVLVKEAPGGEGHRLAADYVTEEEARGTLEEIYGELRPLGDLQISTFGRGRMWGKLRVSG